MHGIIMHHESCMIKETKQVWIFQKQEKSDNSPNKQN